MYIVIGDIAEECNIVTPSTECEEVYTMFTKNSSLEGIVVCENHQPIGLVMKTHFFQKLSTKYGFDLFIKRPINLVMDSTPLQMEYSVPIAEVSALAMKRNQGNLYDHIIVTKDDQLYGVVSIRELLIKMSEVQISIARLSNPLSGLPGNNVIEETLREVLKSYRIFSVLYLDIDSFKAFNDTYGFSEGDEVIKVTGNIITDVIFTMENELSFVGHIGGDDFIAVVPHYDHVEICKTIITRFEQTVKHFYSREDYERGYLQAITRQGKMEKFPLASLSIAVIQNKEITIDSVSQLSKLAAKVKKKCKEIQGSVFLTLESLKQMKFS
ncbi:diguanylate cyclase (GGDEF)-like protein [Oikeobacillus pervagus]|uniref:Diguanylate cyclase (GGDEF)-like protein n=1 Tax=Oikeobacillus pervagus TaxID=1325931 RepID=A0AAJ1T5P8_9BACI|nr:GGDEF domain-containing protein [Oikeobacillus pervagus]MDQ0216339.1 diguanylate cyclase (GGDEF)-like protein [Oikeobacillus pervagus]